MVISRTPFRISFFGGGTDYPIWYREHGGAVLSTSIDKYCYITVRHLPPLFPYAYRIRYAVQEEVKDILEIKHPSVRECLSFLNFAQKPLEVQHNADIPAMTGLGSSSSFTVGLLHALYALEETPVTKEKLTYEAIHIDQEKVGENVGSQDHTTAAFGGFNTIEFGRDGRITVKPLPVDRERLRHFKNHLMLVFTGQTRVASEIALEQIKNTHAKYNELTLMRELVNEAVSIITNSRRELGEFGTLLHEGWKIKKELSSKITNPFVDKVYREALQCGALGGKLLGAGGGGFLLLFAYPEIRSRIQEKLSPLHTVSFDFESTGSTIIYRMGNDESPRYLI